MTAKLPLATHAHRPPRPEHPVLGSKGHCTCGAFVAYDGKRWLPDKDPRPPGAQPS